MTRAVQQMAKRQHRPAGFTLVELMVVMAILGVLLSMLLPAIQYARETARRTICMSHLRNLAFGAQQFHDVNQFLPPARILGPQPKLLVENEVEHGWMVFLLPFVERQELYDAYNLEHDFRDPVNAPIVQTRLSLMTCPTAPVRVLDTHTSGGFTDWRTASSDYVPIMRVHPTVVENGHADVSGPGVFSSNRRTRFLDILDGLSFTLLLTEAAGRPQRWYIGRQLAGRRVRGSGWANSRNAFSLHGASWDGRKSPGPCAVNCTNDREIYAFHTNGANIALVDGATKFLDDQVSLRVVSKMITIRGSEPPLVDF